MQKQAEKQQIENVFSSPHLEMIQKNSQFLEEIKSLILQKSRTDIWRIKGEPNFNSHPYVEWRRGDSCCSIM